MLSLFSIAFWPSACILWRNVYDFCTLFDWIVCIDDGKPFINVSGGDWIPAELLQILKDDVIKVLHPICQQSWKIQQWPQDWKGSGFTPIPKKGDAKEYSKYGTIVLLSRVSKVMLKILQGRLEQYLNWELPDAEAEFRKSRRTRNQIANICWII